MILLWPDPKQQSPPPTPEVAVKVSRREMLLKMGALQNAILNSANFSSIATDEKGVIQIFNVGAERMLGYAASDVLNKMTPADISDPGELIARARALSVEFSATITPGFEALVYKAARGIEDIYELTNIRKDGSRFPAVMSVTALRDEQNGIIGYLLIGTDNTLRKKVEEERMRLDQRLRDLTEQRKMETQYLRAQRLESIGTLAGGIAHDLNNVLAPIMLSVELLKADVGIDPRRNEVIDTVQVSCRRGADLVRQVLAFARGMEGERIPLQLRHLIGELRGIIAGTFPPNIQIMVDVAKDLWPITGDATQIHQVLLNLAVNARDAMPRGGTLTVSAGNVTLDAQYASMCEEAKPGNYVKLDVTDTGQGMPLNVRKRIFEPFFTTKEIGKGTGIGLATVHTIVKSHSGFMKVESEVGRGSIFKIFLPASPVPRAEISVPPIQATLPRGRNELVLVVDDELTIREITRQTLETFGYRVITASDGAEAVALYARQMEQIAVVLTDMTMPIMDGRATSEVLHRINPSVKIITASGVDSEESTDKAANFGIQDFLLKPFTAETLLNLLREVLDRPGPSRDKAV